MINDECIWFSVCPIKQFWLTGKVHSKWIENYCMNNGQDCVRYKLEEEGVYHPDNMLPNGEIDKSIKIK